MRESPRDDTNDIDRSSKNRSFIFLFLPGTTNRNLKLAKVSLYIGETTMSIYNHISPNINQLLHFKIDDKNHDCNSYGVTNQ